MVFDRDQCTRGISCLAQRGRIDRLNTLRIDYAHVNAVTLKLIAGIQRLMQRGATCEPVAPST